MKIYRIRKETKQMTLEGKRMAIFEYKSEDEKTGFSSSDLTKEGTIFRLHGVIKREGRFADKQTGEVKPYWSIEGKQIIEGQEADFVMTTGNAKLASMLGKALTEVDGDRSFKGNAKGIWVKVFGDGVAFERHYWLAAAETLPELMGKKK